MKYQSRREFILDSAKITATVVGAATLGREFLAPSISAAAEATFPDSTCGDERNTSGKVLIAYASQCGTTGEVAEAIAAVLCKGGATVETKWIKTVKDVSGYDAVIVGSAIQKSRWMPEATEFVVTNQHILSKLPVAFFLTCLTLSKPTEEAQRKAMTFLKPLDTAASQVKPVSVGRFAGVLDYSKLSFMYRTVMKRKMKKWGIEEGDYRNWHAIRSWAQDIHPKLSEKEVGS